VSDFVLSDSDPKNGPAYKSAFLYYYQKYINKINE